MNATKLRVTGVAILTTFVLAAPLPAQESPSATGVSTPQGELLSRPARLNVANVSLPDALKALHEASGVNLAFSPLILPSDRTISCACADVTVGTALGVILAGTDSRLVVRQDHLVVVPGDAAFPVPAAPVAGLPVPEPSLALMESSRPLSLQPVVQQRSIGGTVLSEGTLQPLAGAQVLLVGTGRGAVTDINGRFLIPGISGEEATIRVIMIGYRDVEQQVRVGTVNLRILMTEEAVPLDAIVVTGTPGGVQKRALGNSIGEVKAAEVAAWAPIRSLQELLNARAPGVVVLPGTGMVGSGSRIRIRGLSTLSLTNEPLIYVDGVRVNNETGSGFSMQGFGSGVISRLNDLNPEDIESIEILKGPAAATLYGTEAARGVVNIITKKGAAGGARYSFVVKQGANWFQDPEGRMPTNWWRNPATGEVLSINLIESENARGTPVFRTGHLQSYAARMSGGTDVLRYYVSAQQDDEQGAERNNYVDRFSGRANLQVQPRENLQLTANTGYVNSRTGLSCEAGCGGAMWGALFGSPGLTSAACTPSSPYGCGFSRGFRSRAPEGYYDAFSDWQDIDRFTSSVELSWQPFPWFRHRLTVGTDVTDEQNEELVPYATSDTIIYFLGPTLSKGSKTQTRRHQTFNTFDYSGTVAVDVRPGLSSETSLGMQYYTRHIEYILAAGDQFAAPGLSTVSATATNPRASDTYLDDRTLGVYVQEQLGWQGRLFLTGAVRVDNNSAFGADFDFVTYPKASFSWVLNEEPWWSERVPGWLRTFKLRAAYGQSGQQPVAFAALRTYTPVTGPGNTPAVTPGAYGNPDLGPERGTELEIGFDAGFLEDRLGVDFTFYNSRTKDAILLRPLAPSTGYTGSRWVNIGEVGNRGIELLVDARVVSRRNLAWDLTLNLSTNHNETFDLGGESYVASTGRTGSVVGYPVAAFWLPKIVSAERDAAGKITNIMCAGGPENDNQPVPCFDAARRLVAPKVYLGPVIPTREGSVTSTLRLLERLRLTALVDFKSGHKRFNNNHRARCAIFYVCRENVFPEEYDARYIAAMQNGVSIQGEFVEDASFAKLREVSLTYDIPERFLGGFGVRRASLTVAGRNLHTWTGYTGLDPENTFLSGTPGFLEQNNLPQLAQFVTTLRVDF